MSAKPCSNRTRVQAGGDSLRAWNYKEIAAGSLFIALGLGFIVYTLATLKIGTPQNMGAGYFPMILGSMLSVLGVVVIVLGYRSRSDATGPVPWRGIVLLSLSLWFFAATVEGFGLGPAFFVSCFLAALSTGKTKPVAALVLSAGITVFCLLVFVVGLSLRYPILGPWLGGR
jgi:hypothetical protein